MRLLILALLGFASTLVFSQNTKGLLYSNPLIGGNEGVETLQSIQNLYFVFSGGICLPKVRNCGSLRKYSQDNEVLWETFFDTLIIPNLETLAILDTDIYLAIWDNYKDKDNEYLYKLDHGGNILKTVLVNSDSNPLQLNNAIVSLNLIGDTIVVCQNKLEGSSVPDSVFFKFYDKNLNLVKELEFSENYLSDEVYGIHATMDGNYLISKWVVIGNNDSFKIKIIKLNTKGEILWKHEEESDSNPFRRPAQDFICKNLDSNYVFHHNLTEFNNGLYPDFPEVQKRSIKNDSLIWRFKFLTQNRYSIKNLIKLTSIYGNNDLIGVGFSALFVSKNLPFTNNMGWIFKMDQNGKLKWNRNIRDDCYKFEGAYFITATELENGDIVAGGELWQSSFNPPHLSWVVHLDSSGCITPGCTDSILYTHTEEINGKPVTKEVFFKTFPNPVKNDLTIEFYNQSHRPNSELKIINLKGQEVNKGKLQTGDQIVHINMSQMISGVYLVQYSSGGVILQTEKVVKE